MHVSLFLLSMHVSFFLISRHVSFVIQRIMSCKRGQATVKVCRKCVKLSLITFGEWNYGGLENFPHLVLVFLLPHWGMQSSGFCFCNVMKSLDIEYQRTFPQWVTSLLLPGFPSIMLVGTFVIEMMKRNLIFSENFIQLFSRNQSLAINQCSFFGITGLNT